jgi:toxin ParE1/3/4
LSNYVYLAENAGEETADRFLRQADVTFALLAEQPEIGAALTLRAPQLAGLRKWRVQDFENFLIFYLPRPDGASVVRVMHAA